MFEKKVLTYKGKVVFEKINRSKFKRVLKPNVHDDACFMFIGEGELSVRTQNLLVRFDTQNAFLAKCFNYFFELDPHQWERTENIQATAIFLHKFIIEEIYNMDLIGGRSSDDYTLKKVNVDHLLVHFIEGVNYLLDNPDLADDELILFKLREFVQLLLRQEEGRSKLSFFTSLFSPITYDLKLTVDNNIYSNLTLEDFAGLCNMSISTFKRKFKSVYNESPGKYILKQKINKASSLLTYGDQSITEIAYACGFESISSFNRNFKKITGESPTSFKESLKT